MERRPADEHKREIEAARTEAATAPDTRTGQAEVKAEKPTAKTIEARKAKERRRFAEADDKGKAGPTPEQIAEATLSRQMRGW